MFSQLSLRKKAIIISISAALLGGAIYSYEAQGASIPSHQTVQSWRLPNGVVRVETVTWGSSPHVSVVWMTPRQAKVFWRHARAPFAALQRQMAEQVSWMQQQMRYAFAGIRFVQTSLAFSSKPLFQAPGIMISFGLPESVQAPVFSKPVDPAVTLKSPAASPVIPASDLPNSGVYAVSWHTHHKPNHKVSV